MSLNPTHKYIGGVQSDELEIYDTLESDKSASYQDILLNTVNFMAQYLFFSPLFLKYSFHISSLPLRTLN
jgi:hypothetical protein